MSVPSTNGEYRLPNINFRSIKLDDIIIANIKDFPRSTPEEAQTISDLYRQATIIQGDVWEEPPFEWVPPHNMQAADEIGGTITVAYVHVSGEGEITKNGNGAKRVVGMIYETPGIQVNNGFPRPYMYSHLMATDTEVKKRVTGVGFLMKKKQRDNNFKKGITEVRWTYDPLQSINACVNISKCGAVVSDYKRSVYDLVGINAGVEADRFEAVWPIASQHVRNKIDNPSNNGMKDALLRQLDRTKSANETCIYPRAGQGSYRVIDRVTFGLDEPIITIEIPTNFADMIITLPEEIERNRFSTAKDWRTKTRELFEHYFGRGYVVRDFVVDKENRAHYFLEKGFKPE